jgi:hypothetical protein
MSLPYCAHEIVVCSTTIVDPATGANHAQLSSVDGDTDDPSVSPPTESSRNDVHTTSRSTDPTDCNTPPARTSNT